MAPRVSFFVSKCVLRVALTIGVILLFVGGPDYYSHRLLRTAWDLGHILLMLVVGLLLIDWLKSIEHWSVFRRLFIYGFIIVFIAIASEYLQQWVGRSPSFADIKADILGGLLALTVRSNLVFFLTAKWRRLFFITTMLLSINVLYNPLLKVYDEWVAHDQFPTLSGFEHRTELSRWSGGGNLHRSNRRATGGEYSLVFPLASEGYSGIALNHFSGDWSSYERLQVDVWSPLTEMVIIVRIHDFQHTQGSQLYADRFNRRFELKQGWNRLSISLDDVQSSPGQRQLELSRISGVGLFSHDLGTDAALYLDEMVLLK